MTSFLIKAHENRAQSSWNGYKDCAFCRIIKDELPSFRVFENDLVVAVLDILPLRKGHTLVIPKAHFSRLSELPPEYAAAVGLAVTKVAHALTQALDNTALNVVCNQEYAQAVPHVHYHVIPAPTFGKQPLTPVAKDTEPLTMKEMHQREFDGRTELDEEEGEILAKQIRSKL
ncbi:HIT-like protein [Mycena albidolilacea]|uniref:HIT-like protein n=1 Tax=Mycena albidolilacea TaxID=1033008 RepID=A0AAD7ARF4_9AGAR|nr:HIT-like protein [Mycena albidolilacea]